MEATLIQTAENPYSLIRVHETAMKIFLPIMISLLFAAHLFAATPASDEPADEQQKHPQQTSSTDASKPKKTAPATSFTPSEKVGADSAVSFPVDI